MKLDTDAGMYELPVSGKAVVWATAEIQKQPVPEWARKDDAFTLYGTVTTASGKTLAQVSRPVTFAEYEAIDTIIGFYMQDALGCEFGYGMFFGKKK